MIDKFFVVDFDRCIGSVDSSFDLITSIAADLGIISRKDFRIARAEAESKRISFSVLSYIKDNKADVDLNAIEVEYIKRAQQDHKKLQEPGAEKFIAHLKNRGEFFCIMSFGDPHWQRVKIKAAGFSDTPLLLVDTEHKAKNIAKWHDETVSGFIIPSNLFVDQVSRNTKEIILVDDKQSAFHGLPEGVRGYWVQNTNSPHAVWQGESYASVQAVSRISAIIDLEF